MVIVLLLIIIFLLAPWLLGTISLAAISIFSILAYLFPIAILVVSFVCAVRAIKKMPEERKKKAKKLLLTAAIVILVIALIVASVILFMQNQTFNKGKRALHEDSQAAVAYFDELPDRYHSKIADYLIEEAERSRTSYCTDFALSCLDLAKEYLDKQDERQDDIRRLRREFLIQDSRGEEARTQILRDYWGDSIARYPGFVGYITGEEAVQYALEMYDFKLDNAYPMREDAINLLWDLATSYPQLRLAEEKHEQLSGWPEAYRQAAEWVNTHQNYEKAAEWFSAHQDYEHSAEYLSLVTGVLQLCGTWTNSEGDTLVISVDQSKPVELWYNSPSKIFLNITLNNQDISFSKSLHFGNELEQACIEEEEPYENGKIRYEFSYDGSTGHYQIWTYDYDEGLIHLTYNISSTKQEWRKTFSKVR